MLMQFREDENGDTTTESGSLEVWQLRSEELSGGVRPEQWFRRGMRRELAKKVDSSPVLEEAEKQAMAPIYAFKAFIQKYTSCGCCQLQIYALSI